MTVRVRTSADLERTRSTSGDYYSRFSLTSIHQDIPNSRIRYGLWNKPKITISPNSPGIQYHTVRSHELGRLGDISYTYYQDTRYWWVIATYNGIVNPYEDMESGQVLVIPSRESVLTAITQGSKALFDA